MDYSHPPESTEQVLHPEKLIGDRDAPVDVRMPALVKQAAKAGWRLSEEDVAGELGMFSYLDSWLKEADGEPGKMAAGWGGDRYYFFETPEDVQVLVWRTEWDTVKDAEEFKQGFAASLPHRFDGTPILEDDTTRIWQVGDNRFIGVAHQSESKRVDIVDADGMKNLRLFLEKL